MKNPPRWVVEKLGRIEPYLKVLYSRQFRRWGLFSEMTYPGKPLIKIAQVGTWEKIPIYRTQKAYRLLGWIIDGDGRYCKYPPWEKILEKIREQIKGEVLRRSELAQEKLEKDFEKNKQDAQAIFNKDIQLHQTVKIFNEGK